GKINEFLHSRETAYKMGIQSNGAARASSYDREPIPRMANTFFVPGDYTLDELIEDIKFGIYMKSFTEWNIDDKRYNQRYIGRESYIIENGEIKDPVKRPVLEITTPGFYKAVDAAGKDLEFTAGTCGKSDPMQGLDVWMGGPSIRLRNVIFR
ncbi:MAG TPA: TldD/PmbA family protein, partial [Methanomicrobia archaeon]|nr:TldD/PmbA family protein [Methanomicrobia archaeon]